MKKEKRRYELRARGELVAKTRARIVQAIMELHGEVGPRNTTVSAIAARAGVERLTVYRHFQDEAEMFDACSHRYFELNPLPNPESWIGESDPLRRARRGLMDLYTFFGRTAPMFEKIYRDLDEFASLQKIMKQFDAHLRSLADALASAWPQDMAVERRRVILRHAVKFATWQSLEVDGVDNGQKVALIIEWLTAGAFGGS